MAPLFLHWDEPAVGLRFEKAAIARLEATHEYERSLDEGRAKPAERLAYALGLEFEAARAMIRKAKQGDSESLQSVWEAIAWQPAAAAEAAAGGGGNESHFDESNFM